IAALAHYDRAAEIVAPIQQRLCDEIARVHGVEWAQDWDQDLPNYIDVPGEVNVQEIVRLWHFAKALDLTEWGRMRYNLMGNAGHWFPGTHAASFDKNALVTALDGRRIRAGKPVPGVAHQIVTHAAPLGE